MDSNPIVSVITSNWALTLGVVTIFFIILNLRETIKDLWIYFRVTTGHRRGEVRNFLSKLDGLPEETVRQLLTEKVIPDRSEGFIEEIVLSHTQYLGGKVAVGVHDTPTGKVQTEYYVDLVTASCDAKTRAKLANILAMKVLETVKARSQ